MVGQAVLESCLEDARVERVLAVVRRPLGVSHPKLEELVHDNFFEWGSVEQRFAGYDACFFCLGVSSVGMTEAAYRHVTYDLTVGVASALEHMGTLRTFVYVSGEGTNAKGRQMWARVKGETENVLLVMRFPQVFCFRPGYIQPKPGLRSKTALYRLAYAALGWMYPVLKALFPSHVIRSEEVGPAMIRVAAEGYPKRLLENGDIRRAGIRD
jgi:uncharacterized protein YbjT (DUF2867 family)